MSVNTHHAEEVRNTALGIDMRDPIADGAEGRTDSVTAIQNQAKNALINSVKDGIEDLNNVVSGGKSRLNASIVSGKNRLEEQIEDGLNKFDGIYARGTTLLFYTMRKDIEALEPIAPEALEKLKPVDEKCDTRIKTMTITKLSGDNDYYSLAFTRANGR